MSAEKRTSLWLVLAAWALVGIPAGWGVYNTALNARKLFLHNHAPANSR